MGLRRCSFGVRGSGLLEGSIGIRLGLLFKVTNVFGFTAHFGARVGLQTAATAPDWLRWRY